MIKELTKHLPHYISLIGILVFALWGFINFDYDKMFQSAVAIALGISFVIWGVVHHHIHDDLHHKILFEYIAISTFGTVVLLSVIWTS